MPKYSYRFPLRKKKEEMMNNFVSDVGTIAYVFGKNMSIKELDIK